MREFTGKADDVCRREHERDVENLPDVLHREPSNGHELKNPAAPISHRRSNHRRDRAENFASDGTEESPPRGNEASTLLDIRSKRYDRVFEAGDSGYGTAHQ